MDEFFVGVGKPNPVDFQKRHHGQCADAFVPIDKGMVADESISKLGSLF